MNNTYTRDTHINGTELSVRIKNCFQQDNIVTIGDIMTKECNDLLYIPNFGKKSLCEVKELLQSILQETPNAATP